MGRLHVCVIGIVSWVSGTACLYLISPEKKESKPIFLFFKNTVIEPALCILILGYANNYIPSFPTKKEDLPGNCTHKCITFVIEAYSSWIIQPT